MSFYGLVQFMYDSDFIKIGYDFRKVLEVFLIEVSAIKENSNWDDP